VYPVCARSAPPRPGVPTYDLLASALPTPALPFCRAVTSALPGEPIGEVGRRSPGLAPSAVRRPTSEASPSEASDFGPRTSDFGRGGAAGEGLAVALAEAEDVPAEAHALLEVPQGLVAQLGG
jgi:hypothetical protein